MTLQDLLSIKSERLFRETCNDYLQLIGRGSSRDVYRLNSKQVIKVASHDLGYTQNASECDVFNTYGGIGLFNEITKSADSYLWVIQPKAEPLTKEDSEFQHIVSLIKHIESGKSYSTGNEFLNRLYKFLLETEWQFLYDFKKYDSWGRIGNELRIIDYGMNNEAYEEYFGNKVK